MHRDRWPLQQPRRSALLACGHASRRSSVTTRVKRSLPICVQKPFTVLCPAPVSSTIPKTEHAFAIDAKRFCHLCLECLLTSLQIVVRIVWLYVMAHEDFADRPLNGAGHARLLNRHPMLTDPTLQRPRGSQIVGISKILGFLGRPAIAAISWRQPQSRACRRPCCWGGTGPYRLPCRNCWLRPTQIGAVRDLSLIGRHRHLHGSRPRCPFSISKTGRCDQSPPRASNGAVDC